MAGLGAVASLLLVAAGGCIPTNHPLSSQGVVDIVLDDQNPIFAVDLLDDDGRPVLPRQEPYEKAVKLLITDASEADEGAYVDVAISPSEALRLVPVDDTCAQLSGAFRCTAADDGYASFIVRSESDWSGTATVKIVGRAEEKIIVVKPAGLPAETPGFSMVIGEGGQEVTKVPAQFTALACHMGPSPTAPFDKWPEGRIRVRDVVVRASAPSQMPTVIRNAPVIVESLYSEAMLSLDQSCTVDGRTTRLRVQLDEVGQSPTFFVCFSDVGGPDVRLVFHSGELVNESTYQRALVVEPEPRLLRINRLVDQVVVDTQPTPVAEVAAYDANLDLVAIQVDVTSSNIGSLAPSKTLWQLSDDPLEPTTILAYAVAAGSATLTARPRLLDTPACESPAIEVADGY